MSNSSLDKSLRESLKDIQSGQKKNKANMDNNDMFSSGFGSLDDTDNELDEAEEDSSESSNASVIVNKKENNG